MTDDAARQYAGGKEERQGPYDLCMSFPKQVLRKQGKRHESFEARAKDSVPGTTMQRLIQKS